MPFRRVTLHHSFECPPAHPLTRAMGNENQKNVLFILWSTRRVKGNILTNATASMNGFCCVNAVNSVTTSFATIAIQFSFSSQSTDYPDMNGTHLQFNMLLSYTLHCHLSPPPSLSISLFPSLQTDWFVSIESFIDSNESSALHGKVHFEGLHSIENWKKRFFPLMWQFIDTFNSHQFKPNEWNLNIFIFSPQFGTIFIFIFVCGTFFIIKRKTMDRT